MNIVLTTLIIVATVATIATLFFGICSMVYGRENGPFERALDEIPRFPAGDCAVGAAGDVPRRTLSARFAEVSILRWSADSGASGFTPARM